MKAIYIYAYESVQFDFNFISNLSKQQVLIVYQKLNLGGILKSSLKNIRYQLDCKEINTRMCFAGNMTTVCFVLFFSGKISPKI